MAKSEKAIQRGREKYLYVSTVAQRLQCSNQHVYGLINSGELEAVRIGKRAIRVTETSLNRFLDARVLSEYYLEQE